MELRPSDPRLLGKDPDDAQHGMSNEFEIFRDTQQHLVKNYNVIKTAINDPRLKTRPCIAREDARHNAIAWLTEAVSVGFPTKAAGVMLVSSTQPDKDDATAIVNAVVEAYMTQVVDKDRILGSEGLSSKVASALYWGLRAKKRAYRPGPHTRGIKKITSQCRRTAWSRAKGPAACSTRSSPVGCPIGRSRVGRHGRRLDGDGLLGGFIRRVRFLVDEHERSLRKVVLQRRTGFEHGSAALFELGPTVKFYDNVQRVVTYTAGRWAASQVEDQGAVGPSGKLGRVADPFVRRTKVAPWAFDQQGGEQRHLAPNHQHCPYHHHPALRRERTFRQSCSTTPSTCPSPRSAGRWK